MLLPKCHFFVVTILSLPNCHFLVVTKMLLPNCHFFVDFTILLFPNCHFCELTKLSPYQIVITKLSLPNCLYQIDITKNYIIPEVYHIQIKQFEHQFTKHNSFCKLFTRKQVKLIKWFNIWNLWLKRFFKLLWILLRRDIFWFLVVLALKSIKK